MTDTSDYEAKANAFVDMLNKVSGDLCEWRLEYLGYHPDYPEDNVVHYAAYVRDDVWDKVLDVLAKLGFDTSDEQEYGKRFTIGDTTIFVDTVERAPWRRSA